MYYSVYKGYNPGIYKTWNECKKNVNGFKGALFKKFEEYSDAQEYLLNGPQKIIQKIRDEDLNKDIDLSRYTCVFTDGSLLRRNGKIACGYGIYIPKKEIKYSIKLREPKTNNRAELKAIIDAITILKQEGVDKIVIYTDSSYCILIFGNTGQKYKKKEFKNVKNKDLVEKAVILSENTILHFVHVSAHTGKLDKIGNGNDIADMLANKAAVADYIDIDKNWQERRYDIGKYKKTALKNVPREYLEKFINNSKVEDLCRKNEHVRTVKHIIQYYITL